MGACLCSKRNWITHTHRTIPGVHVCVCISWFVQFSLLRILHTHTRIVFISRSIFVWQFMFTMLVPSVYTLTHTQTNTHNKHMHTHIINNKTSHVVVNLEKRLFLQQIFLSYWNFSHLLPMEMKMTQNWANCPPFVCLHLKPMFKNELIAKNIANVNRSLFGLNKTIAAVLCQLRQECLCACMCMFWRRISNHRIVSQI